LLQSGENKLRQVQPTGEQVSWFGHNDIMAKIDRTSCGRYKLENILVVTPLNGDEIFDEENDDENWADPGALSGGRSRRRDGNDTDDSEGKGDAQGGEEETRKEMSTKAGSGKGMGKATEGGKGEGKGDGKGKSIVELTRGGDDISRAVALPLQKEVYQADSDMLG
jgi:hypothetical protein